MKSAALARAPHAVASAAQPARAPPPRLAPPPCSARSWMLQGRWMLVRWITGFELGKDCAAAAAAAAGEVRLPRCWMPGGEPRLPRVLLTLPRHPKQCNMRPSPPTSALVAPQGPKQRIERSNDCAEHAKLEKCGKALVWAGHASAFLPCALRDGQTGCALHIATSTHRCSYSTCFKSRTASQGDGDCGARLLSSLSALCTVAERPSLLPDAREAPAGR